MVAPRPHPKLLLRGAERAPNDIRPRPVNGRKRLGGVALAKRRRVGSHDQRPGIPALERPADAVENGRCRAEEEVTEAELSADVDDARHEVRPSHAIRGAVCDAALQPRDGRTVRKAAPGSGQRVTHCVIVQRRRHDVDVAEADVASLAGRGTLGHRGRRRLYIRDLARRDEAQHAPRQLAPSAPVSRHVGR